MNGVSEVGIFQPDIFNSKIKVLTFNSETHRSQHFLLIGIPFNAILSRELLPLQKYAGGGQSHKSENDDAFDSEKKA